MDASTDMREELRSEIDQAAVGMVEKIERLEDKAEHLKVQVRNSLSIDHHMQARPWSVFGVAVASGFAIGYLTR